MHRLSNCRIFNCLGIVATDPDLNRTWLKFAFKEIFKLANFNVDKSVGPTVASDLLLRKEIEGRVHACNILRVLFRDSVLGDAVLPYVEDGVMFAINGFKADSWPVSKFLLNTQQQSLPT